MNTAYIICGSPGAGKTTYGRQLALELKAAFIDIDTATERLVKLALSLAGQDPDDRDSRFFKTRFRQPIYDSLFDIARENLPLSDVVVTGPFTREIRDPDWPAHVATRLGSHVAVHYVYCPPKERKNRILARNNPRDDAKVGDWETFNTYYGDEDPPCFPHEFIDTSSG